MMTNILLFFLTTLSLFKSKKEEPKVRLEKPTPKQKIKLNLNFDWRTIILIISVILLFLIASYIVFRTGAMESTRAYNNLSSRI